MPDVSDEDWEAVLADTEERIAALDGPDDPVAKRELVDVLLDRSKALNVAGRHREAVIVLNSCLETIDDVPDELAPPLRLLVLSQFLRAFDGLGDREALLRVNAQMLALTTPDAAGPEARRLRGALLLVRRELLDALGQADAAIGMDDQIVTEFGAVGDAEGSELTARALWHKAVVLLRRADSSDAAVRSWTS